jgi:CMP-N-acetylneuraminic acid synthetase
MGPKIEKTLCVVIPFRFGNQDLPNKNLIEIHNKFIFQRALNHALFLKSFINLKICLSTNKPEVILSLDELSDKFDLSKKLKFKKNRLIQSNLDIDLHIRSNLLSSKKSPIADTFNDIRQSYINQNIKFKNWLLLQPTSPFRSKSDLMVIVKHLKDNKSDDCSLISVADVGGNHPVRMYSEKSGKLLSISRVDKLSRERRQDLEKIYIRDGGFYLFSDSLAKKNKLFSRTPNFFVRNYPWNINIDSRYDLAAALSIKEFEVNNDPNNNQKSKMIK